MANLSRTLRKAVSYRIAATLATALLVTAATGNIGLGLSVGVVDFAIKTLIYIAHDYWYDHFDPPAPQ